MLTWVILLSNKYPWGSNPATYHTPWTIIKIRQNTEHFSTMVNTRWKHVNCFFCKMTLFNMNQAEAHYQRYHPILMNKRQLHNGILPPAGFPHPERWSFDCSRGTWIGIDKLSINDRLIDSWPGASPPEDSPNKEPIDPQQPDPTCTPDPTKTKVHRQVGGVENVRGKVYGKATGLYNKHRKYSEHWNPWHPFLSAHDFQQAQSFSQWTKTWIDQHLGRGLYSFKIEWLQLADALRKLLPELDIGLRDDCWIKGDSHVLGTLYYRDIFKCIPFLLAHLPLQAHLDFELVRLADSEGYWIYSEMNKGGRWWDTQDRLPAGAMVVPVICACDRTHLTNFSGDQHAWPLYVTIKNIGKDIRRKPKRHARILVGLFPCPPKGATNVDEAWHNANGPVLPQLRHVDLAGPGLKWDCADAFQRQCYPLLVA